MTWNRRRSGAARGANPVTLNPASGFGSCSYERSIRHAASLVMNRRERSGCQRDSGDIDPIEHHGRRQYWRNRLS
jgi:hypothetical protein